MNALLCTATPALRLPANAQESLSDDVPLTRVSLAYVARRINVYLRFGHPVREVAIDRHRRCAAFLPGARLARIRWEGNGYGTVRWQLLVLQAGMPLDTLQRIPGVYPGASLLLQAEGEREMRALLPKLDAIEALGIDPADVSPAYWRTLGNRLAVRLQLPDYTADRHAAWLAGRALQ